MSALLGMEATAGLSAVNLGLTWGKTIAVGSYEVGADDQADNPLRMEEITRAYALADTPTTNSQLGAVLGQLKGQTTFLMAPLPKYRWAIVGRGTRDEVDAIQKGILRSVISEMEIIGEASPGRVGDHAVKGALQSFDVGVALVRIQPVTLEAHLPAGFEQPNQPALINPFEASAIAAAFGLELPTGVEWEIAAADLRDNRYRNERELRRVAHFYPEEPRSTADVRSKEPNENKLYDMLGNVWEAMANPYEEGKENREFRGGGWGNNPESVRAAFRNDCHPGFWNDDGGFRLLCPQD